MFSGRVWRYFAGVVLASFPCLVLAAELPADALQRAIEDGNRRLREQQELLDRQRQESRVAEKAPTPIEGLPSVEPPAPPGGPCFVIHSVNLQGAQALPSSRLQPLVAQTLGKCLDLAGIDDLLRRITQAYVDAGYITSRAYIPEQDVADGSLDILIVEGRIADIEGPFSQRTLAWTFPSGAGEWLQLRDLEQGLDNLNRLPSNNVTMQLLPGPEAGSSIVHLANRAGSPRRYGLTLDGQNVQDGGRWKTSLQFDYDAPLGLADSLSLTLNRDVAEDEGGRTPAASFSYGLPLGYWRLGVEHFASSYRQPVAGTVQRFVSSGISRTQELNVQRLLHRDAHGKLEARAALQRKRTRNRVEDVVLAVSSPDLSILSAGMQWQRRWTPGSLSAAATYHRGVSWFDATRERDIGNGIDAQFEKVTLNANWRQSADVQAVSLDWSLGVQGQYSGSDHLYSAEQFAVAGLATVRGFHAGGINGNRGLAVRSDVSHAMPPPRILQGVLAAVSPYAGVDAGWVPHTTLDAVSYGRLVSASAGLRAQGKGWQAHLAFSRGIGGISSRDPGDMPDISLTVSASLTEH